MGNPYIGPESKIRLRDWTWGLIDRDRGRLSRSEFIRAHFEEWYGWGTVAVRPVDLP